MTDYTSFYRFCIILLASLTINSNISFGRSISLEVSSGETNPDYILPGTYVVVGVFEFEDNARKFTGYINEIGLNAEYAFYPHTSYYYVYTFTSSAKEEVIEVCEEIRENSEFTDAWVMVARGSGNDEETDEVEPLVSEKPKSLNQEEMLIDPEAMAGATTNNATALSKMDLDNRSLIFVKFRAFRNNSKKSITANVKVVDGIHSRNIAQAETGEAISVDKSQIMDSVVQIIPYAIGYRKEQFDLPIYSTEEKSNTYLLDIEGDTLIMNLPLHRLKKGDIQVMFNTYFHSNSSVMRERSRYELDQLVDMLNENPSMRIKLHGHTNGAGRGFMYLFLPEQKNFFDLRRSKEYKKNGVGSVKLSSYRAETIKSYLESKGIASERIETEGWGGKQMLYHPDSPLARNNIRVEIEVLEE